MNYFGKEGNINKPWNGRFEFLDETNILVGGKEKSVARFKCRITEPIKVSNLKSYFGSYCNFRRDGLDLACKKLLVHKDGFLIDNNKELSAGEIVLIDVPLGLKIESDVQKKTREEMLSVLKKENVQFQRLSADDQNNLLGRIKNDDKYTKRLFNSVYKPRYKLGNLKFSMRFKEPLGKHEYIICYNNIGGVIQPLVFRRSCSEGSRRLFLYENGGKYSKGESIDSASYETTTKIPIRLSISIDEVPMSSVYAETDFLFNDYPNREENLKKDLQITKLFPAERSSAVNFYKRKDVNDVIKKYNNLYPNGLKYNRMVKAYDSENPEKTYSYSYYHKYLGKVNVDGYEMDYYSNNGEKYEVIFYFAHVEGDNRCRIDNAIYKNNEMKYGIYTRQFNIGPLAAKPIDHKDQVPSPLNIDVLNQDDEIDYTKIYNTKQFDGYVDIRFLYQNTPVIKYYRENILNARK